MKKDDFFYENFLEDLAQNIRVLGHPSRLRILHILKKEGETTVSDLVRATKLPQCEVSFHLSKMKDRGLVISRREKRYVVYWIATEVSAILSDFIIRKTDTNN